MLEAKNVRKRFGTVTALDGLELQVPRGSVYGLVGPNGAGKTSFLRCAIGACRVDKGEILLEGKSVWDSPDVKEKLFFIPDEPWFYPDATLKQMAEFYRGIYPSFNMGVYQRLGEAFPFDDRRPLRTLSRGMKKQAAFRLALASRPEMLLLDEPVDGLDPVIRRQVWSLIMQEMADGAMTVLISSHNLRELEDVCSHVGIISHGKMVLQRALEELQENVVKLQTVLPEEKTLPDWLKVLHTDHSGRLMTAIVRASREAAEKAAAEAGALYAEAVPLTLEEIFVYEMGGEEYAVKEILL